MSSNPLYYNTWKCQCRHNNIQAQCIDIFLSSTVNIYIYLLFLVCPSTDKIQYFHITYPLCKNKTDHFLTSGLQFKHGIMPLIEMQIEQMLCWETASARRANVSMQCVIMHFIPDTHHTRIHCVCVSVSKFQHYNCIK